MAVLDNSNLVDFSKQLDNLNLDSIDADDKTFEIKKSSVSANKLEDAVSNLEASETLTNAQIELYKSLKDIQLRHIKLEEAYKKEWNELKLRYFNQFQPLYKERYELLTGKQQDPTSSSYFDADPKLVELEKCRIPDFWLKAMKNHPLIDETIEDCDIPILEYIENIQFSWINPNDQISFKLDFMFSKNPYFKNSVLSKTFYLEPSEDNDEESVLTKTVGSVIEWYEGKNVTEKVLLRRQRNRKTNETRVVSEKRDVDSFFHFFKGYETPTEEQLYGLPEQDVSKLELILEVEFEIGTVFRDKIIPKAFNWYLGIEHDDLQSDDADLNDFYENEQENVEVSESSNDK